MAITLDGTTGVTATAFAGDGSSLTGVPVFAPTTVSGATQALDVGSFNFFDAGTLTADTTVSFSNVPTEARWTYTAVPSTGTSYDLAAGFYLRSLNVAGIDSNPKDIFFKPDGTRLYLLAGTSDKVTEFSLSTAWDVSSAVYSRDFSVLSQSTYGQGIAFKPDGTKMYVQEFFGNIYQYTLSTAWDVSTATYDSVSFSVAAQFSNVMRIEFSSDGTKMYSVANDDIIYQYTLSTAWALNTATYASISKNVSAEETAMVAITFKPDGTKMYVLGTTGNDVNQYTLSTAWDVSTASADSITLPIGAQESGAQGMFISSDGKRLYVVGDTSDSILEYVIAEVTTLTLPPAVQNPPLLSVGLNRASYTFYTLDGGTTVNLINEEVL